MSTETANYFEGNILGEVLATRTYASWLEDQDRRENWTEIVDRYIDFMRENLGTKITQDEYVELREAILKMEIMPSMRLMQFAGKAARRCNVCIYNCSYVAPECFKDLVDIMYLSLSGCIPPDSLIVAEKGLVKIKDLNVGDSVYSWNQDKQAIELKPIIMKHNVTVPKNENIRINCTHGSLTTSKKHEILVLRNKRWQYVPAGSIAVGDIMQKFVAPSMENKFDEVAWMVGAFLGDGCSDVIEYDKRRVRMTKDNEGVIVKFCSVLEGLSGESVPYNSVNSEKYSVPMWEVEKQFNKNSIVAREWNNLVGDLQTTKTYCMRIPEWIRKCNNKSIFISFLAGLFDADSFISDGAKITISTSSKALVDDLLSYCPMYSIYPHLLPVKKENHKSSGFKPTCDMYRVSFSGNYFASFTSFFHNSVKRQAIENIFNIQHKFKRRVIVPRQLLTEEKKHIGFLPSEASGYQFTKNVNKSQSTAIFQYLRRNKSFDHLEKYDVVTLIEDNLDIDENFMDITVADNSSYFTGEGSYWGQHNCGIGFSIEKENVEKFPLIKPLVDSKHIHTIKVEDSREGWCDAFLQVLQHLWNGMRYEVDYALIRPKGTRLKITGGFSGGYELLKSLFDHCEKIVDARRGQKLRPIDLHDIICFIGTISNNSAVRRSALISLSDLEDDEMRHAKDGQFYITENQRCMANNSAVYNELPPKDVFFKEWASLAASGSGERGVFNRHSVNKSMPQRRKESYLHIHNEIPKMGTNPCVTADTWIMTEDGPQQVADLVGKQFVAIVDGNKYKSTETGFWKTGDKSTVELETIAGYKLRLTDNHKVLYKREDGKTEMIEAGKLKAGDQIVLNTTMIEWEGKGGSFDDGLLFDITDDLNKVHSMSSKFQKGFIANMIQNHSVRNCSGVIFWNSYNVLKCLHAVLLRFGITCKVHSIADEEWYIELDLRRSNILRNKATVFESLLKMVISIDTNETINITAIVKSITPTNKIEAVYDCTIPEISRFDANGFIVHNCGEISLKSHQFCNLTEIICRPEDNEETLLRKIRLATILGTYQASLTDFKYIDPKWRENQIKDALLGVSISGICDCVAVRNPDILETLKKCAIDTNIIYADRIGINRSLAITTVKPSGSVSALVNCSSGIHSRYSKYYLKNMRISAYDPISSYLISKNVPFSPEVGQGTFDTDTGELSPIHTYVFQFPVKSPQHAIIANQMNAIEQMKLAIMFKKFYVEHSVSVSIYVKESEWNQVRDFVYENFDDITGMSFFPYDDSVYQLAPWQKITEKEYQERMDKFPKIDMAGLWKFEKGTSIESLESEKRISQPACVGGVCEI